LPVACALSSVSPKTIAMFCGNRSLVKHLDGSGVAVTLRCRSWTCPDCAPLRRQQLIEQARRGQPNRFVTLTVNPAVGVSPADRAQQLARAWRNCIKRLRRQHPGEKFEYLAIFEATKLGEPHLHILCRMPYVQQQWLSACMAEMIEAPIVDIRIIKSTAQAAHYVTKYIGKAPQRFATCKRYWKTPGYCVTAAPEPYVSPWGRGGWAVSKLPLWQLVQEWEAEHWQIERVKPGIVCYKIPAEQRLPALLQQDAGRWSLPEHPPPDPLRPPIAPAKPLRWRDVQRQLRLAQYAQALGRAPEAPPVAPWPPWQKDDA